MPRALLPDRVRGTRPSCRTAAEIVTWYVKRTYVTGYLALLALGLSAGPASAGGILPIGSPAFGTLCANRHTGGHANGTTSHGTGTANGNFASLPLGSPLNQCGGADSFKNIFDSRGVAQNAEDAARVVNERIPGARPEREGVDPELFDGIPEAARDPKIVREVSPGALNIMSNFVKPLFKAT